MRRARRALVLLLLGTALAIVSAARGGLLGPAEGDAGARHAARSRSVAPAATERASKADRSSPFHSRVACEAYLRARPRPAPRGPRIGSWNLRWFPYGTKDAHDPNRRTDLEWLACAIAALDVDVLALQEIVQDPGGRNALLDLLARLDTLTSGHWRAELDDCPGSGRQHVGLMFDGSRVEASAVGPVAELNPGNSACDRNLRPGFGIYARFQSGPDLRIVTVHLDSGTTARDFGNRVRSLSRLERVAAEAETRERDADLLVLGDFNTMGCKDCDPEVAADEEIAQLDALLSSISFRRVLLPEARACTHYQRGHPGVLDHVVASAAMDELPPGARVEVYGACRDLECRQPARGERPEALEHLSDHCPIVLELRQGDRDQSPAAGARSARRR